MARKKPRTPPPDELLDRAVEDYLRAVNYPDPSERSKARIRDGIRAVLDGIVPRYGTRTIQANGRICTVTVKPVPRIRLATRAADLPLALHRQVLNSLHSCTHANGEYCVGFDVLASHLNYTLPVAEVRRIVRHLARRGLAELYRALTDEDGKAAGSGYCITNAGTAIIEELAEAAAPEIPACPQ